MSATVNIMESPLQQLLERGTKTLNTVLAKASAKAVGPLQTATDEVSYLMAAARLAIDALGASIDLAEKQLQDGRLRGLERMVQLRKAAEPVLETGQVCTLLGVSRETIRKKVDRKQLLALPKGGDRVFPAFQFREGAVLPGFAEVLSALDANSPFVVLSFLLSKNPSFDGKSAAELLQAGNLEPVLAMARGLLNHGG